MPYFRQCVIATPSEQCDPSVTTRKEYIEVFCLIQSRQILYYMLSRSRLLASHLAPSLSFPPGKPRFTAMSTFTLPNCQPEVSVHLTPDLSQEQLLSFPAFKTWISTLQHSLSTQQNRSHTFHSVPFKLRKIQVQSVDFFSGGRVGFINLKAEISNDGGEKLPGSVFVRLSDYPSPLFEKALSHETHPTSVPPQKMFRGSDHHSNG